MWVRCVVVTNVGKVCGYKWALPEVQGSPEGLQKLPEIPFIIPAIFLAALLPGAPSKITQLRERCETGQKIILA